MAEKAVKNTAVLRASTHWYSDGASVSLMVEGMLRNMFFFFRFEYHMFYVTYLLTLLTSYISFHFPQQPQTRLENAAAVNVH
jgi:hypothetical protein